MAIRRRGVTAHELSEARLMLETGTARQAAQRATPADIERLEAILEVLDRSAGIEHVERDLAFHLEIAAAAHNPVVEMMLESIAVPTAALMFRSVGDRRGHGRAASHSIASRSTPSGQVIADAAAEAIRAHLTVAQELYGVDYERSVDELARQALTQMGARTGLDDLVDRVLSARHADRDG